MGIFASTGDVAKLVGGYAPLIYIGAALFAVFLALTFASAAKYVNEGGAAYAYTKVAFGAVLGQYVGITLVMASAVAWGAIATFAVRTTLEIFGIYPHIGYITIGLFILMSVLFVVNITGQKVLVWINNLSTIGKLVALVIVIIAGIVVVSQIAIHSSTSIFDLGDLQPTYSDSKALTMSVIVTAIVVAFFSYTGFDSVAAGSQDMQNPEKNLPRALPLSLLVITIIYVGVVFIAVRIDLPALIESHNVVILVVIFKNEILRRVIIAGALISIFGINVAAAFSTPRLLESIAKAGQLPAWFGRRTKNNVPLIAFLTTAAIAIFIPMSFLYKMDSVINISTIVRFIQFLVVPIAVICFYFGRVSEKKLLLEAKRNLFIDVIVPIVAFILTVFLLIEYDWQAQFSYIDTQGVSHINWLAIGSIIVTFAVIPLIAYFTWNPKKHLINPLDDIVDTTGASESAGSSTASDSSGSAGSIPVLVDKSATISAENNVAENKHNRK